MAHLANETQRNASGSLTEKHVFLSAKGEACEEKLSARSTLSALLSDSRVQMQPRDSGSQFLLMRQRARGRTKEQDTDEGRVQRKNARVLRVLLHGWTRLGISYSPFSVL